MANPLPIRALRATLRLVVVVYAVAILGFIWVTKDLTFATLARDPLFAGYSVAVVLYVLGRFVASAFYRAVPDRGHRPSVSIIVPAFNEEEGIVGTIESCVGVDYPRDRVEVIVVNDGSTDATWERILDAKARLPQVHAVDLGSNYGKRAAMAEGSAGRRGRSSSSSTPIRTWRPMRSSPSCSPSSTLASGRWSVTPTCATRPKTG